MDELVFKSTKGTPVTNSLLVAQKFGKRHADVIRAIRDLISKLPENQCKRNFAQSEGQQIPMPMGGFRSEPIYIMTRDGFTLLVFGFTGKEALQFKVDFIDAFNKMENIMKNNFHQIPQSFSEALQLAAKQAEQIEYQQKQLADQRPAVVFRDSVTNADTHITVRELSKLICQNGIEIGERRLYDWLVENKYLIRHKRWSKSKNKYENDYYEPYQCRVEKGLFFTKETVIGEGNSSFIRPTVYITGIGQIYFIKKFLYYQANNKLNF